MPNTRSNGFVLLTSLAAVIALTLAGASLLVNGISQSNIGLRTYHRSNALHLTEAGVQQAALNLRTASTADDTPPMDGITTTTLASGRFVIDPPQTVGAGITKVVVRGTSQLEQRRVEATYRLTAESVFQFSLFGDQKVTISGGGGSGAKTDSYDSRLGAYNACLSGCGAGGSPVYNKAKNGDVGTNSIADAHVSLDGITLNNNSFIDGQVVLGMNAPPPLEGLIDNYNPLLVSGVPKVVSQSNAFPMPDVVVPPGLTCSDSTVTGGSTVTLSSTGGALGNGTYCYRNLTVQGNATLKADGNVTVYLTGELTAQGNSTIGVVNDPTKMLFKMSSSAEATLEQTITGSNMFYGAIYGPKATVHVTGNAEIFGSIIAKAVNLGGSAWIHYDEALTDVTDASNTFHTAVIAWREL